MIHEIDESLRGLIRRDVVTGGEVDVVFDAPTKEWAARRNAPTIDVYLYDVREDLRRRQYGLVDVAGDDGHTVARRQPPRVYKLSYLLTAWTQRPEDEHRLLAGLLACFLRHDHVPPEVLVGSLAEDDARLPLTMAIPPPEDRALSDVWSALGGELKPSLDLVVYAAVDLDRLARAAAPVTRPPRVLVAGPSGEAEEAGRKATAAPGPPPRARPRGRRRAR